MMHLGVYVEPITELAKSMFFRKNENLTGKNIKDLYDQIDKGHPV